MFCGILLSLRVQVARVARLGVANLCAEATSNFKHRMLATRLTSDKLNTWHAVMLCDSRHHGVLRTAFDRTRDDTLLPVLGMEQPDKLA